MRYSDGTFEISGKKDIVNTTIVDITKLGLVEITRKKIGKVCLKVLIKPEMHGGFMDNTEVNISQEIPAYERRYRKISEWFLNCKPAYAILKFIYKYMAYFIAFAYIFL